MNDRERQRDAEKTDYTFGYEKELFKAVRLGQIDQLSWRQKNFLISHGYTTADYKPTKKMTDKLKFMYINESRIDLDQMELSL